MPKVVLGFSCLALVGLSPASALASPILSGAYTLTGHLDCYINGNPQPDWSMIGRAVFVPNHTDSSRGTITSHVFMAWPVPHHELYDDYWNGTYRITQGSTGDGLAWALWRFGTHQPVMSLIFGRVHDGIAQSAEAIGYTNYNNACTGRMSLTRIGP